MYVCDSWRWVDTQVICACYCTYCQTTDSSLVPTVTLALSLLPCVAIIKVVCLRMRVARLCLYVHICLWGVLADLFSSPYITMWCTCISKSMHKCMNICPIPNLTTTPSVFHVCLESVLASQCLPLCLVCMAARYAYVFNSALTCERMPLT